MPKLYFYVNKSKHGDWFEFVHRVKNEYSLNAIQGAEMDKSYRLAVRKDYNLDSLPLKEGDILIVDCSECWVDRREDFIKLGLIRVKSPSFTLRDYESPEVSKD